MPRKTILVVDDDDAVRRGLHCVLGSEGYSVVVASHGQEAVKLYREQACHLALIDMNMPLLPGWGTIAALRELNGHLPVIIITARPDQRKIAAAAGLEIMKKPLDLRLLFKRIAALSLQSQTPDMASKTL